MIVIDFGDLIIGGVFALASAAVWIAVLQVLTGKRDA